MNERETIRTLLAFSAGKPIPKGTRLLLPRRAPSDTLIIAFVRMGGESRPWGVALGKPDQEPTLLVVPEPRDAEMVAQMLEVMVSSVLSHLGHPEYPGANLYPNIPLPWQPYRPPSVWLPNATHIEMLHFLAFRYTFAKRGEPGRIKALNALGRACDWLFQESTRPGQLSCIDASAALRDAFSFPVEPARLAHTGYLVAWLTGKGNFKQRLRQASKAESLPISTSIDPALERSRLTTLLKRYKRAQRSADAQECSVVESRIRAALEPELARRFNITATAYTLMTNDPRPVVAGVCELQDRTRESHAEYLKVEEHLLKNGTAWIASPETDRNSIRAAAKYVTLQADTDLARNARVHDDASFRDDTIYAGDGICGDIVDVSKIPEGHLTRPLWTVEERVRHPLRIREGDDVVLAGLPGRQGEVISIADDGVTRRVQVMITDGLREAHGPLGWQPFDKRWVGRSVTFLSSRETGFSYLRRKMLFAREGPGIWLTHQQKRRESEVGEDDDHDG